MATSPAPDAAAPPGMCPGIVVLGGGGDGGGGDGDGSGGSGDSNGDGKGKGDGASGDGKSGGCADGDPICPITGRMFLRIYDFGFGGPLPLRFVRHYSSRGTRLGGELGFGWSHSFGWRLRERRLNVEVFDDEARKQVFGQLPSSGGSVKNPLGWALSRHGAGFLLRIPRDGLTYTFGPDVGHGWHCLASVSDRNGNTIQVERDAAGKLLGLTDSAGRPVRFRTDERGRLLQASIATDSTQRAWMELARYTYDDEGDLASVTDAEGFTASYHYDAHLMTEHRSSWGLSYFYRYDGLDADAYCVESWGEFVGKVDPALEIPIAPPRPNGPDRRKRKGIHHVQLTYEKATRYTEVENSLSGVTRYFGDDLGRGVKIVDAAGGVTERFFDPETGGLAHAVGPNNVLTHVERDADGAVTFIDPSGENRGFGRFLDENGDEVTFDELRRGMGRSRYDARGNLLFVQHADGTCEEYDYDDRGLVRRYINRQGAVTQIWHDSMGNCVRVDYGGGRVEFSEYDYLGRRVAHIDPSQRVTEWMYDRRSEVVRKRHPDGSEVSIVYDANRKPIEVNENGRITRYEYGGIGWLTKVTMPGGETHDYRYDTEGNRTWMRNPRGQVFHRRFDHAGRCFAWESFEGVKGAQGFNVAGRRTWLSTPLGRYALENNRDGELVSMETPSGDVVAFVYGPDGPTSIENHHVSWNVEYDSMGRTAVDRQGAHELHVAWQGGEIASIMPSDGAGLPIGYRYDTLGGLEAILVGTTELRIEEQQGKDLIDGLGERLVLRRRYDAGGRLTLQVLAKRSAEVDAADAATNRDPGVVFWSAYEYDRHGTLLRETRSDGGTVEYEVNASNQIAGKRVAQGGTIVHEEQLRYDAAGTVLLPGVRFNAHMRPVALHNEALQYDEAGRLSKRLTDKGEWRYRWNDLDQLVRVDTPDRSVLMDYDAKGRRMRKRVFRGGELTLSRSYVWANNLLLHEIDELDKSTRTYIRRMDKWTIAGHVDARGGVERRIFYVLQPNGALDFAVDEQGKTVWQGERTVYGDCIDIKVDRADVDLRFVNQFYDRDVELVYSVMRWYDPRLGLFVTPDPAILAGNPNPRDYAANPLREIDPCGLVTFTTGPAAGDANHHPVPVPNVPGEMPPPSTSPGMTLDGTAASARALGGPGAWGVGPSGANGKSTPGFADCPTNALDQGAGFGSDKDPASPQGIVNAAGAAYGCHTCGSKESGYPNPDHWTCDHQPPRSAFSGKGAPNGGAAARAGAGPRARHESRAPGAVRLYPHCQRCSNAQKTALSAENRSGGTAGSSRALGLMRNQST